MTASGQTRRSNTSDESVFPIDRCHTRPVSVSSRLNTKEPIVGCGQFNHAVIHLGVLDMINICVDGCKYDSVVRRLGRLGDKRHGEPQFIGSGIKTGQPSWKCRTPGSLGHAAQFLIFATAPLSATTAWGHPRPRRSRLRVHACPLRPESDSRPSKRDPSLHDCTRRPLLQEIE